MKRFICNQCRTEAAPPSSFDMPPDSWFRLSSYGKGRQADRYEDIHLCSAPCLAAWGAEELRLQQAEQAAVDEAAREAVKMIASAADPRD